MRRAFSISLLAALAVVATGSETATQPQPIKYEVTSIKRKLERELAESSERLKIGDQLQSGDHLRTGWFSEAEIVAPAWASHFHMGPRTRVRLAHDQPGLLLVVEQGRVKATFDQLDRTTTDDEEQVDRIVTTPSVILAVRGTEYSVAVDSEGNTTVAVFSGTVEAVDIAGTNAPVQIDEGYACTINRGQAPEAPRRHRWRRGQWDRVPMPGAGQRSGHSGQGGMGGGQPGGGQRRRGGSSRHGK
jgi:hypothetical protein